MKEKADCPDFDYFDYEPILQWAEADVGWSDIFVDGHGNEHRHPGMAHWSLIWEKGFIGFGSITEEEDREKARMASALFIYLWCKGVPADIAERCAELYACHVIMRKL